MFTLHFLLLSFGTVGSALTTLLNDLKGWALPIAGIGIVAGAMLWMLAGSFGNSYAGAVGIKVAAICVIAVGVAFGALDLANLGKTLHF